MRVELIGAGVALAVATSLGWAMHPTNLLGDNRPLGPQMLLGASAARAEYAGGSELSLPNYHGRVPDYVVGTDAAKPFAWREERTAAEPRAVAVQDRQPPEIVVFTHAAYDEPPPPSRYPSVSGGPPHHAVAAGDAGVETDDAAAPGVN